METVRDMARAHVKRAGTLATRIEGQLLSEALSPRAKVDAARVDVAFLITELKVLAPLLDQLEQRWAPLELDDSPCPLCSSKL